MSKFSHSFNLIPNTVLEIGGTKRQSVCKKQPNRGEDEEIAKDKKH